MHSESLDFISLNSFVLGLVTISALTAKAVQSLHLYCGCQRHFSFFWLWGIYLPHWFIPPLHFQTRVSEEPAVPLDSEMCLEIHTDCPLYERCSCYLEMKQTVRSWIMRKRGGSIFFHARMKYLIILMKEFVTAFLFSYKPSFFRFRSL